MTRSFLISEKNTDSLSVSTTGASAVSCVAKLGKRYETVDRVSCGTGDEDGVLPTGTVSNFRRSSAMSFAFFVFFGMNLNVPSSKTNVNKSHHVRIT